MQKKGFNPNFVRVAKLGLGKEVKVRVEKKILSSTRKSELRI